MRTTIHHHTPEHIKGDIQHSTSKNSLIEVGPTRFEPGYWQGMHQPAMIVTLRFSRSTVKKSVVNDFDLIHLDVYPDFKPDPTTLASKTVIPVEAVLQRLARMSLDILRQMGMPVMGGIKIVRLSTENPWQFSLGLPAVSQANLAPLAAFRLVCELMNRLVNGVPVLLQTIKIEIKRLAQQHTLSAPAGVNSLNFLKAAHELAIPWRHVANNVYQLGWGRHSRWLDSSFTDETSTIGTALARDKAACCKVLREAGLPVPKHQLVSSAAQAVAVANTLGYPVVVKPANLDGGTGVYAGLRDAIAVENAFAGVLKLSKKILVEQFIKGNDYRLQVHNGEVYWVAHRRPAGVFGNGINTVAQLIEAVNVQRASQSIKQVDNLMKEQGFFPVVLDEESASWLECQGLNLESVPAVGQIVRLRGAANIGIGGTLKGILLTEVHPDNLELAAKAAAILRLDLAGIDFLVPDIKASWKETGGAICEVNAQPQLSSHLHRQLLTRLLKRQGRIPVIGIGFPSDLWNDHVAVQDALTNDKISIVWAETIQACRQALINPQTDAVLWKMVRPPGGLPGMPVDMLDLFVINDSPLSSELVKAVAQHSALLKNQHTQVWKLTADNVINSDAYPASLTKRLIDFVRGFYK